MSCPGGACGKEGMEARLILYGILAACLVVGVIWVSGYRKTAYALTSVPVVIFFFGPQLSRALDRAVNSASRAWRAYARRPGRRYCPECGGALRASAEARPIAGDTCPSCEGSWCGSGEFLLWLSPYGTTESSWQAAPRDAAAPPRLCPQCAAPLEFGTLALLQPIFARCAACGGHWIERMTWTWFGLNPPSAPPKIRRPAPRPESPLPELVLRKDPAP